MAVTSSQMGMLKFLNVSFDLIGVSFADFYASVNTQQENKSAVDLVCYPKVKRY
jgi:hypothetical protein